MPSKPTTVSLDSHAAATLRYIRSSMEGAASFAVPGSAGIALGSIGALATALSYLSGLHDHWFEIWIVAALAAAGAGSALLLRESSLRGLKLIGTPIRRFALCLLPSLGAGVVLTAVRWYEHDLHDIAGIWLLLYGSALISASSVTIRTIGVMGGMFACLGLLAMLLPDSAQIIMLGLGFGGLHLLFGAVIGRMGHGREI
ncbi:MAG TPA: hypothetical protein VGI93_16805 [Steroidobacteraceae bacterium]